MKKTILLLFTLLLLTSGCGEKQTPTDTADTPTQGTQQSDPNGKTEPVKADDLSAKLNESMAASFASTSWYPYIDTYTVYKDGENYTASVSLKEKPYDAALSLFMASLFSTKEAESITPVLLDAGTALGLSDASLCVVAESLFKIYTGTSTETAIASLEAYKITARTYCATASDPAEAVNLILGKLQADYSGTFTGLSMDKAETIARSGMTNSKDPYISKIAVLDPEGKQVAEYENLVPKN